ncbi:beta-ketoacyl-[acyl-carrier-protein] synthase family protein [Streptomyces sp. NPDC006193]|uniref:beta-ketoacyl-[acyl-carrier-protein] synthase family protein n=1 Tax=Streptomyces sp. NPDC006193 TaxID=3155717 RepID=UPI0033A6E8AE
MTRRVVITGIAVIAPGTPGTKPFWERVIAGTPPTRTITRFDPSPFRSRIAAECDFDPKEAGLTPQEIRRMDRAAQFAVVTAREALTDSGLDTHGIPHERTGVSIGTAVGCTTKLDEEYNVLSNGGSTWVVDPHYAPPHMFDYFIPSSIAAEVARTTQAAGPAAVISAGCTSGLDSIGHACDLIREGTTDIMISGGTEAPLSPITLACFDAIKATSNRNDDPEHAMRPFDRTRNGFVLGEGAATLILEERTHALRRGARIYAEILAHATRSNAHHMTGLRPDGAEMADAITAVLTEARLHPADIDWVNAHGTGTRQNDRHETAALKRALGPHAYHTPVSSIKPVTGHSLGAIGSIEIAACALALTHHTIPPTANLTEPDPELDLDYVPHHARTHPLHTVLSLGSGFGGFQSAVLLAGTGENTP